MKNTMEMNKLNFDELDAISGGDELNYSIFDPADNLTESQMTVTYWLISLFKSKNLPKEVQLKELQKSAKIYDFDVVHCVDKYWDVAEQFCK